VALMPVIGTIDISIGVLTLFRLLPAVPLRMVFWGFKKARLRPLSLEPIWKLLERAGNFAMPVALLWSADWARWLLGRFSPLRHGPLSQLRAHQIRWILRLTTAAPLIGHVGFKAFVHKPD
jgi:hypothetical protein